MKAHDKTPFGVSFSCVWWFRIACMMLAASTLALAQTNRVYITDDRPENLKPFTPTPDQIERARHSVESRPAAEDSSGNWGPVTEGFQMSIRLKKSRFTNGEPIRATILLRNVSDQTLGYFASIPKGNELQLLASRNGQKLYRNNEPRPGATFPERLKQVKNGIEWTPTLEPGTQRESLEELTNAFDLSKNGEYTVQADQEIKTIAATSITNKAVLTDAIAKKTVLRTNVISGIATFYVTNSWAELNREVEHPCSFILYCLLRHWICGSGQRLSAKHQFHILDQFCL